MHCDLLKSNLVHQCPGLTVPDPNFTIRGSGSDQRAVRADGRGSEICCVEIGAFRNNFERVHIQPKQCGFSAREKLKLVQPSSGDQRI